MKSFHPVIIARRYFTRSSRTALRSAAFSSTQTDRNAFFGDVPDSIFNAPAAPVVSPREPREGDRPKKSERKKGRRKGEADADADADAEEDRAHESKPLDPRIIAAREAAAAREVHQQQEQNIRKTPPVQPQYIPMPGCDNKKPPLRCGGVVGGVDHFARQQVEACLKRIFSSPTSYGGLQNANSLVDMHVVTRNVADAPIATLQPTADGNIHWIAVNPQPLYRAECRFQLPLSEVRSCLALAAPVDVINSSEGTGKRKDAFVAEIALTVAQPAAALRKLLAAAGGSAERVCANGRGLFPCKAFGYAKTAAEAECVAAMHAQRVMDALGVAVHNLAPAQRRHAEAARTDGRWAVFPNGHQQCQESLSTIANNARDRKAQARPQPLVLLPAKITLETEQNSKTETSSRLKEASRASTSSNKDARANSSTPSSFTASSSSSSSSSASAVVQCTEDPTPSAFNQIIQCSPASDGGSSGCNLPAGLSLLRALPNLYCIAQTLFFENRFFVTPLSYQTLLKQLPKVCHALAPRRVNPLIAARAAAAAATAAATVAASTTSPSGNNVASGGSGGGAGVGNGIPFAQLLSEASYFGSGFDQDWRMLLPNLRGYQEGNKAIAEHERWMDDSEGGRYQVTDFGPPPYGSQGESAILSPHSSCDAEYALLRVQRYFKYHHEKSSSSIIRSDEHEKNSISSQQVTQLWENARVIEAYKPDPQQQQDTTKSKPSLSSSSSTASVPVASMFECRVSLPGIRRWAKSTALPKGESLEGTVAKLIAANAPALGGGRGGGQWTLYRDDLYAVGVGRDEVSAEKLCAMHAELMIDYYGGFLCETECVLSDDDVGVAIQKQETNKRQQSEHAICARGKGRNALGAGGQDDSSAGAGGGSLRQSGPNPPPPSWILRGLKPPLPLRQLAYRSKSGSKRLAPRSFEERFLGHHHHVFGNHNAHVLEIMPTDATDELVGDLVRWMEDPLGGANPSVEHQKSHAIKIQEQIATLTTGVTPGVFHKFTDYFPSMQHDINYRTSVLLPFLPSVYGLRGGISMGRSPEEGRRAAAFVAVETLCRLGQPLYPRDPLKQLAFEQKRRSLGRYVAPRKSGTGEIIPLPPSARGAPLFRTTVQDGAKSLEFQGVGGRQGGGMAASAGAIPDNMGAAIGGSPPLVRDYPPHNDLTLAVGLDLSRWGPREDVSDDGASIGWLRRAADAYWQAVAERLQAAKNRSSSSGQKSGGGAHYKGSGVDMKTERAIHLLKSPRRNALHVYSGPPVVKGKQVSESTLTTYWQPWPILSPRYCSTHKGSASVNAQVSPKTLLGKSAENFDSMLVGWTIAMGRGTRRVSAERAFLQHALSLTLLPALQGVSLPGAMSQQHAGGGGGGGDSGNGTPDTLLTEELRFRTAFFRYFFAEPQLNVAPDELWQSLQKIMFKEALDIVKEQSSVPLISNFHTNTQQQVRNSTWATNASSGTATSSSSTQYQHKQHQQQQTNSSLKGKVYYFTPRLNVEAWGLKPLPFPVPAPVFMADPLSVSRLLK